MVMKSCDVCGGRKLVVSYGTGEQIAQGKIDGVVTSFAFNICVTPDHGEQHEVCHGCARAMREAVTSTIFKLKRPTVLSNV